MKKAPLPLAPKTITWFEQAITAATPTTGILASVDQGIWSIAETAGQLAGIWRRHRTQMQDLDDEAVTTALGELLAAIVQTTHAVGVPLETLMTEQAERMRKTTPQRVVRKTRVQPARAGKSGQNTDTASVAEERGNQHQATAESGQPHVKRRTWGYRDRAANHADTTQLTTSSVRQQQSNTRRGSTIPMTDD